MKTETVELLQGAPIQKLAYSISEAARVAPFCRTRVYEELKAGRLKARKAGRRTLILSDDLAAWLRDLPDYEPS